MREDVVLVGVLRHMGRDVEISANTMGIYLHSTPARDLFERPRRDFSHGCIRVADAVALVQFVFSDRPEWTQARIEVAMARGQRQTAALATDCRQSCQAGCIRNVDKDQRSGTPLGSTCLYAGKGKVSEVGMVPNVKEIDEDQARQLVHWILSFVP